MKYLQVYFLFISILYVSCADTKKKEVRPSTVPKREQVQSRTKKQKTDIRVWHFPYVGKGAIPCFADIPSHSLTISGFDTDGQERFYIAGGEPLVVAAYENNREIYRRTLDCPRTQFGMMHLHGDSLYVFNDRKTEVISMHVDGEGETKNYFLPIDTCIYCTCSLSEPFYLNIRGIPQDTGQVCSLTKIHTCSFFRFRLSDKYMEELPDYADMPGDYYEKKDYLDSLEMGCKPPVRNKEAGYLGDYIGTIGDNVIYVFRDGYETGIVNVYSRQSGEQLLEYSIPGMPDLCPFSDDGTINEHCVTIFAGNVLLRKDKIYLIGYMPTEQDFQILEINIKNIIEKSVYRTR